MSPPPHYSLLKPALPAELTLSNVRLGKSTTIDHKVQLESLKSRLDLFSDRHSFWLEVSILDRLHYKNINQQRPFKRFTRGMEVRRVLKRIQLQAVNKELERLYRSFWNAKNLDKCTGNWNFIPSKESIQYTMHSLISTTLLLDKLKITLIESYRANSTLLKLEHFVSLALVYMGTYSRLYKLAHIWQSQIEECYHFLYHWAESFPSGLKQKEEEAFISTHNLHCEADTLKVARSEYSQEMARLKVSDQKQIHLESFVAHPSNLEIKQEFKANHTIDDNNDSDLMDFEDLGEVIQR